MNYTISTEEAGGRVDNFLLKQLKGVPKSRIYRAIRGGEVRVNKGRVKAEYKLQPGDIVRIPPIRVQAREPISVSEGLQAKLQEAILYEDAGLIILNKPAGIPVHGGSGVNIGVIEAFRIIYPKCKHLDLVHRLDKDTSGCLMLAKKRSVLKALHEALREGKIKKHYLALVAGHWPRSLQKITLPLRKQTLQSGERMVKVDKVEGKEAITFVKPLRYDESATLLEVTIKTGRTHQIRVHTAASKHPILGDEKYGSRSANKGAKTQGIKSIALHASQLHINLPEIELQLKIKAPDPEWANNDTTSL
jgi:23S rRNA pseudouridine955/2504/2580 synthase